jgi:hypothetical protein
VTGRPSPIEIIEIFDSLNNAKFNEAFDLVIKIKQERSLALEDIMSELHKEVMTTMYTDDVKMYLVSRMAEIEYRLA